MKKTVLLSGVAVIICVALSGCVYNCIPQPAAAPKSSETQASAAESGKKAPDGKGTSKSQEKLEPVTGAMRQNNEINFNEHRFLGFDMPLWMYSITWDKLI